MTPDQTNEYLFTQIEPRLAEIATSYAVVAENKLFMMLYSGDLGKIAFMFGQVIKDFLQKPDLTSQEQHYILSELQRGILIDFDSVDPKGEF